MFEEEAKKRQLATQNNNAGRAVLENFPKQALENKPVHSHKMAAEVVNVSDKSIQHASKVLSSGTPELVQAVETGHVAML